MKHEWNGGDPVKNGWYALLLADGTPSSDYWNDGGWEEGSEPECWAGRFDGEAEAADWAEANRLER